MVVENFIYNMVVFTVFFIVKNNAFGSTQDIKFNKELDDGRKAGGIARLSLRNGRKSIMSIALSLMND